MAININDAGEIVKTSEADALVAIMTALDTLDMTLETIANTLPTTLALDAARVIADIRGSVTYRRSAELPTLLAKYGTSVA